MKLVALCGVLAIAACSGSESPSPDVGSADGVLADQGVSADGPSDRAFPDVCAECPRPTCQIACYPHVIQAGESTTFFWESNGERCHLTCTNDVDKDVPCKGEDSDSFQDMQKDHTCTLHTEGPGPARTCEETVIVL